MTGATNVLTDLAEWERGFIFPLAVLFVAFCAGGILRCLRNILTEFQQTRRDVQRITVALEIAGILPVEGHPRTGGDTP